VIRVINFAFIAVAAVVCLALYRIADHARVAEADLRATEAAIAGERDTMTVLGAEWARLTQPARIQALAERHLNLSDKPTAALSSLTVLPNRNAPPVSDIRAAKATLQPGLADAHTGT
jgi:hypothetical protein